MKRICILLTLPLLSALAARAADPTPQKPSAHPPNAFYDASVETRRVVKNLKTDFGASGNGSDGDSEKLQAAIDAVSKNGGGVVQIPAGEYCFTEVNLRSNVCLEIDKGVSITPFLNDAGKSVSIFNLGVNGGLIENVSIRGIGGRYTVRLPAFEPGIRVFSFKYVRNFLVSDVTISDRLTKFSCFQFATDATAPIGVWRPTSGTVANANVTGAAYGYGLAQIQAAESVLFENLSGQGGVTLRLETGLAKMNDAQVGGMANIVGRNIECSDGNAAVMISPHSMHNGVVKVDGVKSTNCGFAVRIQGGFISQKYTNKALTPGDFAPGCYVRNVEATFGMSAQLKTKHYRLMHEELVKFIKTESEDGESHRGPSIAAVVNAAENYHVEVENVTAHGFQYQESAILKDDLKEEYREK